MSSVRIAVDLFQMGCFNQLTDDKTLDRSKLKQSADNNFTFDENSRKASKGVIVWEWVNQLTDVNFVCKLNLQTTKL